MKRIRSFLATLALIASLPISILVSLLSILVFLIVGSVAITGLKIPNSTSGLLIGFGIGLVIGSIIAGIVVIIEIMLERRTKKANDITTTTEMKDITMRFHLREGPVTIEAPDVKSVIEVLQGIQENLLMKSENRLKAESHLTVEIKEPEDFQLKPDRTSDEILENLQETQNLEALQQLLKERQQQKEVSDIPETKESEE